MTRVRLKNCPDITGTIIREGERGEVVVAWDGDDFLWKIGRDRLVFLEDEREKE